MKLLQFALRASSTLATNKELTEKEAALLQADHWLPTLTVIFWLFLLSWCSLRRTNRLPYRTLGAEKTRAAAAMIAGLVLIDSTLKIMVVTEEKAAAHAFAKHIESLQLSFSLEEKFGRLVGTTELEKDSASQTKLDVQLSFRNDVLRAKQVIIGCEVDSTRHARSRTVQLQN